MKFIIIFMMFFASNTYCQSLKLDFDNESKFIIIYEDHEETGSIKVLDRSEDKWKVIINNMNTKSETECFIYYNKIDQDFTILNTIYQFYMDKSKIILIPITEVAYKRIIILRNTK